MPDSEVLQQIRRFYIQVNFLVDGFFAGEYQTAFKGRGLEFEGVRRYQVGDDIRNIDWKVTARAREPFVREYREERDLTVMLLVDRSGSMRFGTKVSAKNELAAKIAAVIGSSAVKSGDRTGLMLFSDKVESYIAPQRTRGQVWKIVREIVSPSMAQAGTSLQEALEFLLKKQRQKTVVFLISDFMDKGYFKSLTAAAKRHQIICLIVSDPAEGNLPALGMATFRDMESNQDIIVNAGSAQFRKLYRTEFAKERERVLQHLRSLGLDTLLLETDKPVIEQLIQFFRSRRIRNFRKAEPYGL